MAPIDGELQEQDDVGLGFLDQAKSAGFVGVAAVDVDEEQLQGRKGIWSRMVCGEQIRCERDQVKKGRGEAERSEPQTFVERIADGEGCEAQRVLESKM